MGTEPARQVIRSRAPTRIDLAGGTVDLWPLYLFLDRPVTLNLGIDLYAEADLEVSAGDRVKVVSEDQKVHAEYAFADLDQDLQVHPALQLHVKFLRYFAKGKSPQSLTLSTRAKSPAGAGLGGSSTLSIAIVGALATWAQGKPVDPLTQGEHYIEIVRDVETTVIQVPAGVQDYYGAMFGGLQSLRWGFGSHTREWLPSDILPELQDRLLLFYSGHSRNSGINNWALFKSFIDEGGKPAQPVREKFARINAATKALEAGLRARDWTGAGRAIDDEWSVRRTLAPGITTPEIDQAFADARKIAQVSGKICGAGGGGCFFVYLPTPDAAVKSEIEAAFSAQGVRPLPFRAVPAGLEIFR